MGPLPTTANIRFDTHGAGHVEGSFRLTAESWLQCSTYSDSAPILSVDDGQLRISIGVPCPDTVTDADLDIAHRLAELADRYVTELEIRLSKQDTPVREAA